jgi:predicted PurR-regulated permease PerM
MVLVVLSYFVLRPLFMALFLGALLAYISYPLYSRLHLRIKNRSVAALIVCTLVFLIIIIPGIFFVKTLVEESFVLYLVMKQKLAVGLFNECQHAFCETLQNFSQNQQFQFQIQEAIRGVTNWIIQQGSSFLISVPKIVVNLFIMLFTLFYFLVDGKLLLVKLNRYFGAHKEKYKKATERLQEITQGIIYGYVLVAVMQGAFGALGFFLFGISSPLLWGLVMSFLALIPILGTGFVWVPASLFLFLEGVFQGSNSLIIKGIGLFVYCLIFVSSLDNIIRPKLIGDKAKVHPAIVLLGIFGGLFFFGPLGVLLGPLILSLTVVVLELYLGEKKA